MKQSIILLVFITFCSISLPVLAQNKKALKLFKEAETEYLTGSKEKAIHLLNEALKKDDNCIQCLNLKGQIYLNKEDWVASKEMFTQLLPLQPEKKDKIHYQLAKIEMNAHNYESALGHYENLSETFSKKYKDKITEQVELAELRMQMMKEGHSIEIHSLGKAVNSEFDEYLPSFTADGKRLFFTRKMGNSNLADEDFYWSELNDSGEWTEAQELGAPVNTPENQEGALSISPDGKRMFFARKRNRKNTGFDLFYSYQLDGKWVMPMNMGAPISTNNYDSQPSISADGKELYFASRRSGGKGGIDIWKSSLVDNHWQEPVNVRELNTPENDQCPFLHPDGQTLYYSSNGLRGMGKSDLFKSTRQADGTWSKPENLGYPINTSADENSLIVDREGERAYFSKLVEDNGFDLFYFNLPPAIKPQFVTYIHGKVSDFETNKAIAALVEITDLETGEVINTIQSDESTGDFLLTLPLGKEYAFSVNKSEYVFYSEHFPLKENSKQEPLKIDILLTPIAKPNTSFVLENIFFETGTYQLKNTSFLELDKLVGLLNENPLTKIEITGHTDDVGDDQSNMDLSLNRAKSVRDYLVEKGISTGRIQFFGKGETEPIADNETNEGRAKNRRTEFKIQ